jgi:TolB-like protein/DNA-binding winged helix-turn-helix (wHTH) protein
MPTGCRSLDALDMNRPLDLPLISVDLAREADFWIGSLKVQPSCRQVGANGHQETIQPRVMQVLVALARVKGAVLSRDNLVETCWDGLSVGDDAINRCIAKVRQIADLGGGQHFAIETIARVGYRLAPIALPVSAPPSAQIAEVPDTTAVGDAATLQPRRIGSDRSPSPTRTLINRGIVLVALAVLIVALVGVVFAWVSNPQSQHASLAHREPLLAVLPFRNLNADAASQYFSDGITQEVTDALLQATEIRVAASASSFALRPAGAARTAKTLAATHVLSGSVERHGDDLRVVAQLADMDRDRVIWSRICRTTVAQTPALQHHIAVQIANALDMRLSAQSLKDSAHVDPIAYDHYLRGRDMFRQRRDPLVAEKELETSTRLAPGFAKAWATLAAVRYLKGNWFHELKKDSAAVYKQARNAANRALALDPGNADAIGVLAATSEGNRLAAERLFERSLRAEPNNTQLLNWHHIFLLSVGRNREASDEIERAYELDRLTPAIIYNAATNLAERGDFERARQIIDLGTEYCSPEVAFDLRAQYLLSIRDWSGLAQHLGTSPAGVSPQIVSVYRLAGETSVALANGQSDKFAALRTRWRVKTIGDRVYAVTFLTLLGDTGGALKVIDTALAAGANSESNLLFTRALPALRRSPAARVSMAKWGLFEYWRASNHWPDFCDEPGLPFSCKGEAHRLKT